MFGVDTTRGRKKKIVPRKRKIILCLCSTLLPRRGRVTRNGTANFMTLPKRRRKNGSWKSQVSRARRRKNKKKKLSFARFVRYYVPLFVCFILLILRVFVSDKQSEKYITDISFAVSRNWKNRLDPTVSWDLYRDSKFQLITQ